MGVDIGMERLKRILQLAILCSLVFACGPSSSDGNRIAFNRMYDSQSCAEIVIANLDDGNEMVIIPATGANDFAAKPVWNPVGNQLIYLRSTNGVENTDLYLIDLGSNENRLVVGGDSRERMPNWSPDGNYISFSSDRDGDLDIYIVKQDGSKMRNITGFSGGNEYFSSFTPDGQSLYFDYGSWDNGYVTHMVDLATGETMQITDKAGR